MLIISFFSQVPVREEIIHKTNLILKNLQSYSTCDKLTVDANDFGGTATTVSGRKFTIEVIDAISPYVDAVKEMFDFALIRDYIKHLKLMINCCNGGKVEFVCLDIFYN